MFEFIPSQVIFLTKLFGNNFVEHGQNRWLIIRSTIIKLDFLLCFSLLFLYCLQSTNTFLLSQKKKKKQYISKFTVQKKNKEDLI